MEGADGSEVFRLFLRGRLPSRVLLQRGLWTLSVCALWVLPAVLGIGLAGMLKDRRRKERES